MPPPLTVVIVHRDASDKLARAIATFADQEVEVRPLVVDNGSRPSHLAALRTIIGERGEIVELGTNTGFGPAANAGWRRWLEAGEGEWVGLMPHDALVQPGTLDRLLAEGSARPRAGLVSADVGDGATPVVDRYLGGITRPAATRDGWEDADHPHGTLMLARRPCLAQIGLFDERYFAYCEEADLGIRAGAGGWEVGLVRGARVVNPSTTSGSAAVDYLQLRNTLLLVREHSGRYPATIRWLIAVVQLVIGTIRPEGQLPWFSPRARVRALIDAPRGR